MKNLMSNLKGMNYKEFAVNHAEKIVLCFIALFVVFAIFTSEWTTEKRTPAELSQKIAKAESQVKNSQWPEEQRKEFLKPDELPQKVEALIDRGLSVTPYQLSTDFSRPLYREKAKAKEVDWLPVEDLIATAGRFIMMQRPPETEMEGDSSEPGEPGSDEPDDDDMDNEFKKRTGGTGGPGGSALGLTFGGIDAGAESMSALAANDNFGGAPGLAESAIPDGTIGMDGMMGGGMAGPAREGRGLRFISVRGVFDLATQQDKLQRALGDAFSMQNMQTGKLLDFLDFELERKKKSMDPDNPWSGEWKKVDIQTSIDVLKESADFDPPVVNTSITDRVFTMPLPSRIAGFWYKVATHPRVENFTLSQEEIEQEVELNARFLKEYKKTHADEKVFKEKQKGFSELQLGMRQIRSEVMFVDQPAASESVFQGMAREMGQQATGEPLDEKKFIQKLKANATAVGRLLLFRYFDFDLQPGDTYRYRVRFVIRNPNFQRPIEEVVLPSVAEGEIRTTPWSNETAEVHVEQDTRYFLSSVRPPRGVSGTTATFEVFQWYPETGTTIHNSVIKTGVGEIIGGERVAELYDVAKEEYSKDAKVNFDTQNYLVDAIASPSIRPEDHPDLNLSTRRRGQPALILPEAIVVDNFGNLKKPMHPQMDSFTRKQYARSQTKLKRERNSLKWVMEATEAREAAPADGLAAEGFDAIGSESLMGMEAEALGGIKKGRKGKRKKNPISLLPR